MNYINRLYQCQEVLAHNLYHMQRECTSCHAVKDLGEFHTYKTGWRAGTPRAVCIECTRKKNTEWYRQNKERVAARAILTKEHRAEVKKRWRKAHAAELAAADLSRRQIEKPSEMAWRRQRQEEYARRIAELKSRPCTDCGHSFPSCVMDFDHRDPLDKKFSIGIAAGSGTRSWESIAAEIVKCDLVCANCHRIRTAKQFGWRDSASAPEQRSVQLQLPLHVQEEVLSKTDQREPVRGPAQTELPLPTC